MKSNSSIGLNDIKLNDSINVVVQALGRVAELRNFFLIIENYNEVKSALVHAFGALIRKIWSPYNFRAHVSPHEFLQTISTRSKKKFAIGKRNDPVEFMSWLLNTLHRDLSGKMKNGSSIVTKCFRGLVQVKTTYLKKEQPEGVSHFLQDGAGNT